MFLGHFGVGVAAKRVAPSVNLGTLLLAAQLLDLIWPSLLLLGVERVAIAPGVTAVTPLDFEHYPFSHSLVAAVGWGLVAGALYRAARGVWHGAVVTAVLVPSHWALDALVHRPDLPLAPFTDARVGLGLWHSLPLTLAAELSIFCLGAWLYASGTRARDRAGQWGMWALLAVLLAIQMGSLFGAPPPSVAAVAWVGQAQWLLVAWGYWLERHRVARGSGAVGGCR